MSHNPCPGMILPWFFSLEESQWSRGSSIRWFGWFWSNSHYALKNEKQCNGNEYLWDFFKNSVQYRVRHNVYIILGKKFILATLFRIFSLTVPLTEVSDPQRELVEKTSPEVVEKSEGSIWGSLLRPPLASPVEILCSDRNL